MMLLLSLSGRHNGASTVPARRFLASGGGEALTVWQKPAVVSAGPMPDAPRRGIGRSEEPTEVQNASSSAAVLRYGRQAMSRRRTDELNQNSLCMWVVDIECRRIGPPVDAGYDTCFLITSGTSGRRRSRSAPPRHCTHEDRVLACTC